MQRSLYVLDDDTWRSYRGDVKEPKALRGMGDTTGCVMDHCRKVSRG